MKHSMIWKTTIREIKGSFGRFMAIFAIAMLGVGLFSGLKITKTDFIKSTTEYFKETSFFDYRIVCELGFSDRQVELLKDQKDVLAAEGAFSCDAYYLEENGNQKVGKFLNLPTDVNKVILTKGRMPESAGECLADSYYYGEKNIGKIIKLSDDNTEDELGRFTEREYKIVGLVKSPLYVQFERGNTSLGTGSIDAFFYLRKDSFQIDYYTDVYVKFRQNFTLYSDEWKSFMAGKDEEWKLLKAKACHDRFLELPELISDARKKLSDKKIEADKEFADAKTELDDALEQLIDAENQISEGKDELLKGTDELIKAKQELEDAKKTIAEKESELAKGWEQYEKGKKKIEESEALIAQKETELKQAKTQLEATRMTAKLGEMQYKLTMEGLISEQKSIDSSNKSIDDREKVLNARESLAKGFGYYEERAEEITKEREKIAKEREEIQKQLEDLNRRYRETLLLGDQLTSGKKLLEENEKQFAEGENALDRGKEELLQAKKELIDAQKKLENGENELQKGKQSVLDAEKEIADGEKIIEEKEKELLDGEEKLKDGKKEYEEGLEEYQSALREYEDKIKKAEDAIGKQQEFLDKGEDPAGYLLGRDTNIGHVCFESDSAIVDGIANVFPVFFFLVAALICMTTMNRMVEEQRTQIGILKALGYSDGQIHFKFLFYSGLAAVSGAIVGYVGGTHVFPFIIWTVYGIIYEAGPIRFAFDPLLAGISLFVALLCSVGTTYVTCRKELMSNASKLMRPRAPKAGKRVFLEYVPFIWNRFSFLRKVAVRNVMRYKKRFFMMVLGIGGCTGLLLTGFGLKDSIAGIARIQFTEIQFHDVNVQLQDEVDDKILGEFERLREKGLGQYLVYQESNLELVTSTSQKSVTVITFPKDLKQEKIEEFVALGKPSGEKLDKPGRGEAIVTDKIAKMLGIREGDEIILRDSDQKEIHAKVSGIALNYIFNFVFMDQTTWDDGEVAGYSPKSIYVKMQEDRDVKELTPRIMKMDGIANVSVTKDMVTRFDAMMRSMNLIVVLITACAAGLAFIVLFNLTNINVTERIREIATIKVLGFYPGETALYVFRENFVLTVLGAFVGLFMGVFLHKFVISEINVDMVSFGARIFPASYAYSVLLTLAFSGIVSLMMNKRLDVISMTESLKSVD